MNKILKEKIVTAKKDYTCNACWFILNYASLNEFITDFKLTFSEIKSLVKAKQNHYTILKGEKCIYQVGIYDGDFYTSRAIPEIHEICIKYKMYNED